MRHMLDRRATFTGKRSNPSLDPLRENRADVVGALRSVAADKRADRSLRAAALVALGRAGEGRDAQLLVGVLEDARAPSTVKDSAAVALGLLQGVGQNEDVRRIVADALSGRSRLSARTRGLVMMSAGLRAREDRVIASMLASHVAKGVEANDAASIAIACGLAEDIRSAPELMEAALKAKLGRTKLNDVARSHVAFALGRIGDPTVAHSLMMVVRSRSAGVQTRRSAVLALGRLLRKGMIAEPRLGAVRKALAKTLRGKGDMVVRGFAALALAGDKEPQAVDEVVRLIDGGRMELRPFAALALGIAARNLDDVKRANKIRQRLVKALDRCHDVEQGSALSIAVGLAGAREALPLLLERVQKRSLPTSVRGSAALGAGMLGAQSPQVGKVLLGVLEEDSSELAGDVALGLGLTGRRTVASVLLKKIPAARSTYSRGRMVLALGYLGSASSAMPLLASLRDGTASSTNRAQAAIALGLLGDVRDKDTLFDLAVDFNFFATDRSTRELLNQL